MLTGHSSEILTKMGSIIHLGVKPYGSILYASIFQGECIGTRCLLGLNEEIGRN